MLSAVVISLGLCVPAWSAAQFCCTQSHRAPTAGGGRQVITQAQCSFTHTYTQNSFPVWLFPWQTKINCPLSFCSDVSVFTTASILLPLLRKAHEVQLVSWPLCILVVIFSNCSHNNVPQAILFTVMHWKGANLNANTTIRNLG